MKRNDYLKLDWLKNAVLPRSLWEYLNDSFSNQKEKELAFIVCRKLYGNLTKSIIIPISYVKELGYCNNHYQNVFDRLLMDGLIYRVVHPNRTEHLAGVYRYYLPKLWEILRKNDGLIRGIFGKKNKRRRFLIQDPLVKKAISNCTLEWNQEAAMDYCESMSTRREQYKYTYSVRNMSQGFMWSSWNECPSGLYANNPPLNIIKGFWTTGIVGGGETLFSVDFSAFYPNLTSYHFLGRLCGDDLYESFIAEMNGKYEGGSRADYKILFNRYLNGGHQRYMSSEGHQFIKSSIQKALNINNTSFTEIQNWQTEARETGKEIMNKALVIAYAKGFRLMIPVVDCFYTTHNPEDIKECMLEASSDITGLELPIKIKDNTRKSLPMVIFAETLMGQS